MKRLESSNGLKFGHFINCYYIVLNDLENGKINHFASGYLEACLVSFHVIESKTNGLIDYQQEVVEKIFGFKVKRKETRFEIILRLSKEFITKNEEKYYY